jgi:hypothetical protein
VTVYVLGEDNYSDQLRNISVLPRYAPSRGGERGFIGRSVYDIPMSDQELAGFWSKLKKWQPGKTLKKIAPIVAVIAAPALLPFAAGALKVIPKVLKTGKTANAVKAVAKSGTVKAVANVAKQAQAAVVAQQKAAAATAAATAARQRAAATAAATAARNQKPVALAGLGGGLLSPPVLIGAVVVTYLLTQKRR